MAPNLITLRRQFENSSHNFQYRRALALIMWAVKELTLLFSLFHGDPPVQGPAKKTQSLLLRRHLLHFALPYLERRSSSSVINSRWIDVSIIVLYLFVIKLEGSAHINIIVGVLSGNSCIVIVTFFPKYFVLSRSGIDLTNVYFMHCPLSRTNNNMIRLSANTFNSLSFLFSSIIIRYVWGIYILFGEMMSRPMVLTQAIRLSSIMQLATGRTSWCLKTRKIDFPVQNSFLLFDLTPLTPGRRQLLLSTLTFDWNFNWVSLQSWIKRWSQGQSSQSLGTNISLLGILWILSRTWSPIHLHSSRTGTSSWPHSVADAIFLIFLLRMGDFVDFELLILKLDDCESSMPLPPWTRRTRALITLMVMGFPSCNENGIFWGRWACSKSISVLNVRLGWLSSSNVAARENCSLAAVDAHAGSETIGAEVGWWYWKHALSIHLSKRDCCNNGGTRSSTRSHFPWTKIQVLRRQSAGSLTPAGLVLNNVGVLTTKIGSIPGSSWSFSRLERPLRYTVHLRWQYGCFSIWKIGNLICPWLKNLTNCSVNIRSGLH